MVGLLGPERSENGDSDNVTARKAMSRFDYKVKVEVSAGQILPRAPRPSRPLSCQTDSRPDRTAETQPQSLGLRREEQMLEREEEGTLGEDGVCAHGLENPRSSGTFPVSPLPP